MATCSGSHLSHGQIAMKTTITILFADGREETKEIDMAEHPTLREIENVLTPYFDGAYIEHVNVLTDNGYSDMFVDEDGFMKTLPRNEKATTIYRSNWLEQHPQVNPESMNHIVGTAVVFSRRVWF